MTPRAKVTVTTIGNPSGIAATARLKIKKTCYNLKRFEIKSSYLTPMVNISSAFLC
jgi:hypothetical protein